MLDMLPATTPLIAAMTPVTGRMVNEQNEIHNVVDDYYGSLRTMGVNDSGVHDGQMFFYTTSVQVASLTNFYLLLATGTTTIHVKDFIIKADQAPVTIELFESGTVSANGTAQTTINRNRQLTNTATISIFASPTVTSDGTRLMIDRILGAHKDVTSDYLSGEWLLKKSNSHLIKINNGSNQAANIMIGINWMECE